MRVGKSGPKGRAVALAGDTGYRARFAIALTCAAVGLVLVWPSTAHAGWPLAQAARVTLGFGAVYSSGEGDSSRHRGVDIEAAAGDRVIAPLSGSVTFAGSVPGVGGGRVTVVTIETARGYVTLLPLETVSVSRGARVGEGDGIGTLAGSGDGSSAGAHLHVGAREGDLYVDPLGLIAPPPTPAGDSGAGVQAPQGAGATAGATAGAAAGAAAGAGEGISAGVSLAPAAGTRATRATGHAKPTVRGELSPGVSIAIRGSAPSGVVAKASTAARPVSESGPSVAAEGAPQTTMLTRGGVVLAAGTTTAPSRMAGSLLISRLVTHVRALAERFARVASLVLLGVMAALGALWPLWRGVGRKGPGKVLVSAAREDVAAAPSR